MKARGRFYEDGPYTYCDNADVHPQPCLCAAPNLERLPEVSDAFATAAAAEQMARDELWKRRPPLDPACEHELLWLLVIEFRQSVICRKCGGLDVETSRKMLAAPPRYAVGLDGSTVAMLDSGVRVTLEENRGEETAG